MQISRIKDKITLQLTYEDENQIYVFKSSYIYN